MQLMGVRVKMAQHRFNVHRDLVRELHRMPGNREIGLKEVEVDKVAEQEALVSEFIEECRPIIEDPEAGVDSLCRVSDLGSELLTSVNEVTVEAVYASAAARRHLNAVGKDRNYPPGKILKLEKEWRRLEREHKALEEIHARIDTFMSEVRARLDDFLDSLPEEEESTDLSPGDVYTEEEGILHHHEAPLDERVKAWWRKFF